MNVLLIYLKELCVRTVNIRYQILKRNNPCRVLQM